MRIGLIQLLVDAKLNGYEVTLDGLSNYCINKGLDATFTDAELKAIDKKAFIKAYNLAEFHIQQDKEKTLQKSNVKALEQDIITNCKAICKCLEQSEDLHLQKFKEIIRITEGKFKCPAFISPEEFYRSALDESMCILESVSIK